MEKDSQAAEFTDTKILSQTESINTAEVSFHPENKFTEQQQKY